MTQKYLSFTKRKGAGLVAYSIVIGLIAVLSIYALQNTGNKTSNIFSNTLNAVENSLNPGPKIGDTRPVAIQNGSQIETWNGNEWELTQTNCHAGYHSENNICLLNERTINISNGTGTEIWTGSIWTLNSVSCDSGYHEDNLTCVSDTRVVAISNGSQTQSWNGSDWDVNSVSCNSGYIQSENICIANTGTWSVERTGSIPSGSITCSNNQTPSGTCSPIGSVCYTSQFITPTPPTWLNHKATCN